MCKNSASDGGGFHRVFVIYSANDMDVVPCMNKLAPLLLLDDNLSMIVSVRVITKEGTFHEFFSGTLLP